MSGSSAPIVYWDAGIFIALLAGEKRKDPADMDGIREQVQQFERKRVQIATSVITFTEVLRGHLHADARTLLDNFFRRENTHLVQVDRRIAILAHDIRDFYTNRPDGLPTVTVPDALHLATAIDQNCTKFYTFDGDTPVRPGRPKGSRPLLSLNGVVAGRYYLAIEKPRPGYLSLPMFKPEDE
jgi:predicted nucleic acid-binding protein